MLIPIGFFGGGGVGNYELISAYTLSNSTTSTITFDNVPQKYKHLQIIMSGQTDSWGWSFDSALRFNNDSGSNYSSHTLITNPAGTDGLSSTAATSQTQALIGKWLGKYFDADGGYTSAGSITDILDYSSTTKNTTIRSIGGASANQTGEASSYRYVHLRSGAWYNTAAVSRIDITLSGAVWRSGAKLALYGIGG